MDNLDMLLIEGYINIPSKIQRIRGVKKAVTYNFNHIPYISSTMGYNEDGTRATVPNTEKLVINYVDQLIYLDKVVDVLKFKYKHFKIALNELHLGDSILQGRPKNFDLVTNKQLLNAIADIEEATSWRYKLEPELASNISDDPISNVQNALEFLL